MLLIQANDGNDNDDDDVFDDDADGNIISVTLHLESRLNNIITVTVTR